MQSVAQALTLTPLRIRGYSTRIIWERNLFQPKEHVKKTIVMIMVAAGACLGIVAQADEILFTTLPETVQTTVIQETHIASSTDVLRVIHDSSGVYAITVRGTEGDRIVYVNEAGALVQAPGTTTTTTVQTAQPAQAAGQPVKGSDGDRYL